MKTYNYVIVIVFSIAYFSAISPLLSQVGINTDDPRATLEVAGDMKVSESLKIGSWDPLSNSGTSNFLIQEADDYIKSIDVSNPTGAALGYIQEYIIENPNKDWVRDFDTGIDANDYVLVAISSNYNRDLALSNAASAEDNFSLPYTATFVDGGTWHIIADYPMAANINNGDIGTWVITTLIYSSDLSKQFGVQNVPMANGTTGSALTPIID